LSTDVYRPWPKEFSNKPPWNIALAIQCFGEVRNLTALTETSTQLLKTVCLLLDYYMLEEERKDISFFDEHIAPIVLAIGPNWPNRAILAEWLNQHEYPTSSTQWLFYETFGSIVGTVGANDQQIQQILLANAKQKQNMNQRILAIFALAVGWHNDKDVSRLIYDWVTNEEDSTVRGVATQALAHFFTTDPETPQILYKCAVNDPDWYVRDAAIRWLTYYFSYKPEVLSLLRDRAVNDISEEVRYTAVWEIADFFRDDTETLPLLHSRAVNDESPSLDSERGGSATYVRESAISMIAEYWPTHPKTLPLLRDRAQNDPTPWLRERAKELIEEIESKKE